MQRIKLGWLKAVCREMANHRYPPFSIRRVQSATDWIPERKRFAFAITE